MDESDSDEIRENRNFRDITYRNDKFNKRISYFINCSYLHGLRFLNSNYGFIARIYWIFILIASLIGMIIIFLYTIDTYAKDAMTINVDTAYLRWNNTFPAISFCMLKGFHPSASEKIQSFVRQYYQIHNITEPSHMDLYLHILNYLFLTPTEPLPYEIDACYDINSTCGVNIDTLKQLIVPDNCRGILTNITFIDKTYDDCEELFKIQNTEMGTCFTANGVYFYDYDLNKLPLRYSRSDKRTFTFKYIPNKLYEVKIFIHSPEDFPNFNSKHMFETYAYNTKFVHIFQTIETENSINTREESIEKRECRFPDERIPNSASLPYSFASCLTYARVQIELRLCNCTMHTSPIEYKDQYCNYKQSVCVAQADTMEKTLDYHNFVEPCLPSCTEMEIFPVGSSSLEQYYDPVNDVRGDGFNERSAEKPKRSTVVIEIQNSPSIRYVRNVSFTRLNFIVTIGGVIGLFFGASILSLIEIIYIWFIRQF